MRIVFMGTPAFALPSLKNLLDAGQNVVAVVTAPDKPRGRGRKVSSSPVKDLALQRGLPIFQPDALGDPSFIASLAQVQPDLIVVVAFRILPTSVFTLARSGAFNLHASLLPKYRGAAPINWAIINGETETGVTTFMLQEKVDTGTVLLQARVRIGPDETAGELYNRLADIGAEIVLQTVRLIELGKARPQQQDDALATQAPKLFRDMCRIPWLKSAGEVHNFIRGLAPSPSSWTTYRGMTLKVYRSERVEREIVSTVKEPGTVVEVGKDAIIVQTGSGLLAMRELQLEGRKRMGVAEFLRGHAVSAGERFL
jgi:methionyl-tRNA formyltransferase